jgi:dUTP pyrophosphatase
MLEEQFAITPALSSTACFQVRCSLELPGAKLPECKSAGAAGWDLTAAKLEVVDDLYIYDTGLAVEIPQGYFGAVCARSSIFMTGLEKCGGVTVVDSDYRGTIKVMFRDVYRVSRRIALTQLYPDKKDMMRPYCVGERIAQLIILPCAMVTGNTIMSVVRAGALYTPIYPVCFTDATGELSATARGTGGYGSTGV